MPPNRFRRFAATVLGPPTLNTPNDLRRALRAMAGQETSLQVNSRAIGINVPQARTATHSVYLVSPGKVEKWTLPR